jgi:hypothetical protein
MRLNVCLFLVLGCFIQGCITTSQYRFGQAHRSHESLRVEDESIVATLEFVEAKQVNLSINNKTDMVIELLVDPSSFTYATGVSSKLIPAGTRYIDSTQVQPSIAIPPKSNFYKSFFSADSVSYVSGQSGGWKIRNWIPNNLTGSSFVFPYKVKSGEGYLVFKNQKTEPATSQSLGPVSVAVTNWNILFQNSVTQRRKAIYNKALETAQSQYGNQVELRNLRFIGKWSPMSLLLYFSILGFVEDASLTADVFRFVE